jgi:hypothetical protein
MQQVDVGIVIRAVNEAQSALAGVQSDLAKLASGAKAARNEYQSMLRVGMTMGAEGAAFGAPLYKAVESAESLSAITSFIKSALPHTAEGVRQLETMKAGVLAIEKKNFLHRAGTRGVLLQGDRNRAQRERRAEGRRDQRRAGDRHHRQPHPRGAGVERFDAHAGDYL